MSLRFLRLLSVALPVVLLSPAWAQPSTPPARTASPAPEEETIQSIKLSDAPLETVLQLLEQWTGRTILRPQTLPTATYTLNIVRPMPKSEAIHALETILSMNQIGLSPMGDRFLKVTALAQTRTEAPEMLTGSALDLPPSGRVMSKVFQLDFLRVSEFIPQINTLLNPQMGGPVIFDKTNAALITDSVSNLQRVETLVRELDKPITANMTPRFYPLHFAKASDLVNKLRALFQGPLQGQLGSATTYTADDRTNQVIVIADRRQREFFDDLIAKLDVKAEPNTRNEVIYLKHASSKDVSTLLSQLVSGQNNAAKSTGAGGSLRPGQVVTPNQPAGTPAAPATNASATLAGLGIDNTTEFSSLVTIIPDERSNAVIVSGTVDDVRLIRELVEKIDIVLAQVKIEVIIAEVTLNDNDKSGIASLGLTIGQNPKNGKTQITNFSSGSVSSTGGVTSGIAGWAITGGVVNPLAFQAFLGDTGANSNVKILSAPTIMAVHNKEAEIIVGQSQPIITGSTSSPISSGVTTANSLVTSSQVTYKDIAIDLKVTPLIGDDGSIELKIDQKVDDILGNVTIDNNLQPIIGRRQATSYVNVIDGQMIVLGGLQRTKNTKDRTKLGFFHEIPILSQIFGGRNNTLERTELLLFIRPHVIRPEEGGKDARKQISEQSNRDQINDYLTPPAPSAKKK
ncbi:type II secretory pathway, component PulD [Horticoccus luteus]|uniref:Type II secretory pathway, component PulD n=1 Tax=Horticoccus luteus TaxID=2862869 RepID=A0A8F9TSC5_9BACT|nr:secretin N-terminal domain-containing protein [Horticoccus luteus]QYM78329.1 type II secretory pathway, component PulD [Horticoccus luteus]